MYKIVLLFCFIQVVISNNWHKIFLEKSWTIHPLGYLSKETFSIQSENALHILQVASQYPDATLACVESSTKLIVSKSRISPHYLNKTTDAYVCYTKIPKDYAFASVKDGTEIGQTYQRKDNLEGPYMGHHHTCVLYSGGSPFWLSFDLGTPKKITSVTITSAGTGMSSWLLQAGHILYSNSSSTPGDFSEFKTFGTFPTFKTKEIRKIERSHPVVHIAITSKGLKMFICHVLIL